MCVCLRVLGVEGLGTVEGASVLHGGGKWVVGDSVRVGFPCTKYVLAARSCVV